MRCLAAMVLLAVCVPSFVTADDSVPARISPPKHGLIVQDRLAEVSLELGDESLCREALIWSAWLATNSYAHLRNLAPALEERGFGNPGDSKAWTADVQELSQARLEDSVRAAARENALIRRTHMDRKIDFFSGGSVVKTERGDSFVKGSTQVVWAEHRTAPVVFVAFRGTETTEQADLYVNADVSKRACCLGGNVHSGFSRAVDEVFPLLAERLEGVKQGTQVILTGHSLGGALATEVLARLLHRHEEQAPYRIQGLYTFGTPKVGDAQFAAHLSKRAEKQGVAVVRIIHQRDIVPEVPPAWLGFAHCGTALHLGATAATWAPKAPLTGDNQNDHSMQNYYAKLLRLYRCDPTYPLNGLENQR